MSRLWIIINQNGVEIFDNTTSRMVDRRILLFGLFLLTGFSQFHFEIGSSDECRTCQGHFTLLHSATVEIQNSRVELYYESYTIIHYRKRKQIYHLHINLPHVFSLLLVIQTLSPKLSWWRPFLTPYVKKSQHLWFITRKKKIGNHTEKINASTPVLFLCNLPINSFFPPYLGIGGGFPATSSCARLRPFCTGSDSRRWSNYRVIVPWKQQTWGTIRTCKMSGRIRPTWLLE